MSTITILGISSIVLGALCVTGAFIAYSYRKPVGISVGLGIGAFFFLTVIPVILAVFYATSPG
ncbi:hypothetical protein [Corynebacterium atrinae]|uniref:hypothetical protein n=1 Tax=Corynebacterium atrinae TaxID=1336740 RepID=UPI0025B523D9|nr:hypothetical protein [Corynebacterium atrinae]